MNDGKLMFGIRTFGARNDDGEKEGKKILLKHFALNLNHLTLPEIKDFNALADEECLKLNAKRYKKTDGASRSQFMI